MKRSATMPKNIPGIAPPLRRTGGRASRKRVYVRLIAETMVTTLLESKVKSQARQNIAIKMVMKQKRVS